MRHARARHRRASRSLGALLATLALTALSLQVVGATLAGAAPGLTPKDVAVDLVAAGPYTYDHITQDGTGPNLPRYDGRNISKTAGVVESLEGGDFACGDLVIFFTAITIDSAATGADGTVELDMTFLAEPTGQPGAGFDDILDNPSVNAQDNAAGGGNKGLDGNETVTLSNEHFGQQSGQETLFGTITVTHLDPGEQLIARVVGHLGCLPGSSPTGNLQTAIIDGRVDGARFGVGNQTVPFKKIEDLAEPGIAVTKSCPVSAGVGDTITYDIEVSNTGNEALNNVTVNDTILGNLSGSYLDTLAIGASEKHSFTYTVKPTDPDPLVNTVTVTGIGASSGVQATAQTSCTTTVTRVDVSVTKSANQTTVNADDTVTFTLEARNTGTGTAKDVTLTDTFPASVQILSAVPVAPATCTILAQTVTCDLGDLAPGATAAPVSITVKTTTASCPKIENQATVSASNETAGNSGNNTSNIVTVNVICPDTPPDPQIVKASDAPIGGVSPGESFTYTVTVENVGQETATGVVITDVIPAGLEITGTSAGCAVTNTQTVTCSVGDLAAGASASITITVRATEDACPEVTNNATVTATNEPPENAGNNTSNDVTTPVNCPEPGVAVQILKSNDANRDGNYNDNEEARRPDADVPFLLVVANTGEAAVKITDLTDSFDGTTIDLLDSKCADLKGLTLQPGETATCRFSMNNYSPPADEVKRNLAEVCVVEVGGNRTDCDDDPSRVRSRDVLGQTITPPGGTAFTGMNGTLGLGTLTLALLLLGSGLLWTGYRRRTLYDG